MKDQYGYQLKDQKWISNPTQVLSPNSPSNEAELPLNQRHLGKAKLEKRVTQKANERLQNQLQGRRTQRKSKMQLEDMTSPKAS